MNSIKIKSLKQKHKILPSITDSNSPTYESNKTNTITEYNSSNNSLNKLLNMTKTSVDFNNSKRNRINNLEYPKSIKFFNASEDKKANLVYNKTISSFNKSKGIFPNLIYNKYKAKHRPSLLKLKKNLPNEFQNINITNNNANNNSKDRLSSIKTIFNKNDNNKKNNFKKDLKKIDDNKYKYSIIIKNLDMWDKDHCHDNKYSENKNLFNLLYEYFEENDLITEKNDLVYASNIIKVRHENNYNSDENKQQNKIIMDLMKGRKKERGTIFRSSVYKNQVKLGELFDKKYTKEFDENFDLDPDTFNLLLEDQMKSMFYNQIVKDRIKYEKQLHDDLLKINNIIFKRKNLKEEKTLKLKEYYTELTKLKKEYNEKYTKNRKNYWIRYDSYEHYYKKLKESGNLNYRNQLRKKAEYEDL